MRERIAMLRKSMGLTQKQFGEKIGVQRGTVANYELGRNKPTETVLQMICRVYNVRREWLDTGKGDMFEINNRYDGIMNISNICIDRNNESFRLRLLTAIAELSEEQLAVLAEIAEKSVKH